MSRSSSNPFLCDLTASVQNSHDLTAPVTASARALYVLCTCTTTSTNPGPSPSTSSTSSSSSTTGSSTGISSISITSISTLCLAFVASTFIQRQEIRVPKTYSRKQFLFYTYRHSSARTSLTGSGRLWESLRGAMGARVEL